MDGGGNRRPHRGCHSGGGRELGPCAGDRGRRARRPDRDALRLLGAAGRGGDRIGGVGSRPAARRRGASAGGVRPPLVPALAFGRRYGELGRLRPDPCRATGNLRRRGRLRECHPQHGRRCRGAGHAHRPAGAPEEGAVRWAFARRIHHRVLRGMGLRRRAERSGIHRVSRVDASGRDQSGHDEPVGAHRTCRTSRTRGRRRHRPPDAARCERRLDAAVAAGEGLWHVRHRDAGRADLDRDERGRPRRGPRRQLATVRVPAGQHRVPHRSIPGGQDLSPSQYTGDLGDRYVRWRTEGGAGRVRRSRRRVPVARLRRGRHRDIAAGRGTTHEPCRRGYIDFRTGTEPFGPPLDFAESYFPTKLPLDLSSDPGEPGTSIGTGCHGTRS